MALIGLMALVWLVAALPLAGEPVGASLLPQAEMTVHVTDEGAPIEGALVSIDLFVPDSDEVWWSGGGNTGADGSVVIVMPPGSYEVSAFNESTGQRASTRGFLAPESTSEVTLALLSPSAFGGVVVEVLDGQGTPIPGITAGVGDTNPPEAWGETGGDGRVAFVDLAAGNYVIGIYSPTVYAMFWRGVEVVGGETVMVRFVLIDGVDAPPPGPPTSMHAVGGQGHVELSWSPPAASSEPGALPITAYLVTLDGSPEVTLAADVTDHRLEGVATGDHEVGVAAVHLGGVGAPATTSVTVAEPSTADDVTFEMRFDGAPLPGGTIALVGDGGTEAHGSTDARGRVSFIDVPTGSYEVWASGPGWDESDGGATAWLVFPGVASKTTTAVPDARVYPASGRPLDVPHALAVGAVPIDMRTYADVPPEHPFFQPVRAVTNAGIARGSTQGFRPAAPMSRQAEAAWLARRAGVALAPCTTAPFADVPVTHPFCPEIRWLATSGATEGYGDGTFRPSAPVTRQSAAAFLWRLAAEPPALDPPTFSDVGTDHPFRTAIEWMAGSGRSSGYGDGTFQPGGVTSRQAMAVFLYPDVRSGALDPENT